MEKGRIIIAILVAVFSLFAYYGSSVVNPVTGEKQRVSMTPRQEVALGLEAVPTMVQRHGGQDPDPRAQALVDQVGQRIVAESAAKGAGYPFEFHLLADRETVNAFALPGGQVFITRALFNRFKTEGQLAGVLGHEVSHVIGRHSAEQIAKAQLSQGLTGAAVIASYDPQTGSGQGTAAMAALIGQMVTLKHGREDELEADRLGLQFMAEAGYDPRSLIEVMKILAEAGGGGRQPEFFSTHPNPENRIERISQAIREMFPNGIPEGLRE